ncbi:MAG: MBL fold metallo-hydrolase [Pyrinomonadaceae bacterium]
MNFDDYRVEVVPDTEFRLDGGAMFGVVPRVLWERVCKPDELNRVGLNMNCVFIETPTEKILIDTGIGEKWSDKEVLQLGINREKPFADRLFENTGCRAGEITIIVNTHLHFDHAGGNTILKAGEAIPQFPNARYFVSKSELEHAENPHERDRASYLPENWRPIADSGQLEVMPDDYEVVEGLWMETIRGHSKTMETWKLDRGGATLYGFADLIPTRHHLRLAWIMGYDLYPAETLEFKKMILPQAATENWICLLYHDVEMPLCRVEDLDGKFGCTNAFS